MSFHIDPKWSQDELDLHKERYDLLVRMDDADPESYQKLAKRYHELNKVIGDDDYKC